MPDIRKRSSSILNPPSSIRIPRAGRYYLLVAITLLAVGLHRSVNLLMLLGYALLVMAGLNFVAAGRSLRRLRVRRRIAEWLFARTPCDVEVQVSNPSRLPRLGLRIEDSGAHHAATWYLDWLPGRGRRGAAVPVRTFRTEVVLPRRGYYAWGAVVGSSGYPLGLVERCQPLVRGENAIVLPALGWLHRGRFLRHLRSLTVQSQQLPVRHRPRCHPAAQAEFHGLRAYHSGDSPRLIHWRTSARRGELIIREFEDEPSDNLLLVIDPNLPAESDYCGVPLREQFEEAVSLAATICWEWCRRRGDRLTLATAGPKPVVLEGLTGPAHARRVLECLAVLECVSAPVNPDVIARLKETGLPAALVVLVALGRSFLMDALPRALGRPVNGLDATQMDGFDFYTPPNLRGEINTSPERQRRAKEPVAGAPG